MKVHGNQTRSVLKLDRMYVASAGVHFEHEGPEVRIYVRHDHVTT
jgi:hypothetical protein